MDKILVVSVGYDIIAVKIGITFKTFFVLLLPYLIRPSTLMRKGAYYLFLIKKGLMITIDQTRFAQSAYLTFDNE